MCNIMAQVKNKYVIDSVYTISEQECLLFDQYKFISCKFWTLQRK